MASGQKRSWLSFLGFTVITVLVVYAMLDVAYPRSGLFRIEAAWRYAVAIDERTAPGDLFDTA